MDIIYFIISTVISILLAYVGFVIGKRITERPVQLNNEKILQQRALIQEDIDNLQTQIEQNKKKKEELQEDYQRVKQLMSDAKENAEKAHQQRMDKLDEIYAVYEDSKKQKLEETLLDTQIRIEQAQEELNRLKDTRLAAIEAARKEKEIQEQPDDYKIPMEEAEIHDIEYLNTVMPKLKYPEVLGKCIWSVFFQKKMKTFLTNILGPDDICGIYKVTDMITQEAYIGQSRNIQKRIQEHIRCGVGASPVSNANQLYAAMRRDGIWNFTFELLESCLPEQLNDKERYFIDIYSSDIAGLNSKRGNQ